MVYRLSPENVRPPRGGPSGALAMALVLALVVGIWFVAGGDPGSRMGGGGDPGEPSAMTEAPPTEDPVSGLPYVAPSALPPAGLDLFVDVTSDSPPAGRPFGNEAGQLPAQDPGYYTEHLVGSGALRLVVGLGSEAYWSEDGGTSFARVGP